MSRGKVKKGLCADCRGSRTQHTLDAEGCWCRRCLMGSSKGEPRCQEFVELEVSPSKREEVYMVKMVNEEKKLRAGSRQREVFAIVRSAGERGVSEEELEDTMCRPVRMYVQDLRGKGLLRSRGTRLNKHGVQTPVYVSWQHVGVS